MKRLFNLAVLSTMLVLTASLGNNIAAQDDGYYEGYDNYDEGYDNDRGEVSYQTFYDELSPHGRWVDNPEYGYVWVPNAGPNFRPYSTNGHWVWTDNYEWMWVSDYSWGWAPFHYGRWNYDPYYGWVWVPGYEWSPAWVAWRQGGDYYGWAPLRPGINISINFSIGGYNPGYDYWCFAPRRYILSPRIYDYCYDRRQNVNIFSQTIIINNYSYNRNIWRTGPSRYEAERYVGRITPVRFRETSRPGRTQFRNNEVSMFRPRIQRDENRRFSPRNVERYDRQSSNNDGRISRNGSNNVDRNNGAIDRSNDRRFERTNDSRGNGNPSTRGNGNNLPVRERAENPATDRGNNPRQFERRNVDRGNNNPVREQSPVIREQGNGNGRPQRIERNPQSQPQEQRQFERRNVDRGNSPMVREQRSQENSRPMQMERRQQSQPQQMERRQESQPQRMERAQQPQAQQRQFERRDNGGNGNGNGGGNGRGRNKN